MLVKLNLRKYRCQLRGRWFDASSGFPWGRGHPARSSGATPIWAGETPAPSGISDQHAPQECAIRMLQHPITQVLLSH